MNKMMIQYIFIFLFINNIFCESPGLECLAAASVGDCDVTYQWEVENKACKIIPKDVPLCGPFSNEKECLKCND